MENRRLKKRAFTLIELLIVTVVILALMGVMFRLTGIASGASNRETTVYRMQCLENCLSGYYAAFGSYPPVPLQGASRNIFRKTDTNNPWIQSDDPAYFGGYIGDNYYALAQKYDLTKEQIVALAKNSFAASWISEQQKAFYLAELDEYLANN